MALVESERRVGATRTSEQRSNRSSLPAAAQRLNQIVPTHWQIENQLPWVLATAFGQDQCRVRMGAGAQHRALLRRVALRLRKPAPTTKAGITARRR